MTFRKTILLLLLLLLTFVQGAGAQEYISFNDGIKTQYIGADPYDSGADIVFMSSLNGKTGTFSLGNRTLYKDDSWNTLCLPFNVTINNGILYGAEARTLSSATFADGTLTLTFSDPVNELQAGVPYIIRWDEDSDLENPNFGSVTLNTALNPVTDNVWIDFVGNYEAVSLSADDRTVLYLGTNNTLYYPHADMTIGLCRARFVLKNGLTAGDKTSEVRAFVLNFGEGEETGIKSLSPDPSPSREGSDYWHTLDGRRLAGKPTHAGVYIINGKKVVTK